MPCEAIKGRLASGERFRIIACSRGHVRRRGRCEICGAAAEVYCDGRLPDGKTCDLQLCRRCAVHAGADVDYCPGCAPGLPLEAP